MKRFLGLGSVKRFSNDKRRIKSTVVVHGGAGDIGDDINEVKKECVKVAACVGFDVLLESGCVVEAVHEAVRILELYSCFNVIRDSSSLMEEIEYDNNNIELEASIMRGNDLNCGAISGVTNLIHPISLARLVMEKTQHKKLVGENAMRFAAEHDFAFQSRETLLETEAPLEMDSQKSYVPRTCGPDYAPVGAVAIDMHGNIAAACSGGNIGAGIYVDNLIGGVSVASHGETIRTHKTASRILAMIQCHQLSARQATIKVIENLKRRYRKSAGAICIDTNGNIGIHFTTDYMPWAYRREGEFHCGIEQGEDEVTSIECSMEL